MPVISQGQIAKVSEAARMYGDNRVPRELAKLRDYDQARIVSRLLRVT